MQIALEEAQKAFKLDEVPVGAVIIDKEGNIVAKAHNLVERHKDATAHAEIIAIRKALAKTKDKYLSDFDIYVTLEPCPMCAATISLLRFRRLYFGAYDVKSGGVENGARIFNQPSCHHVPEIYGGIAESKSAKLIKDFFAQKREKF